MPGHLHRVRVRYAETDQMGVAHHSSYVAWLEEARIAWLRDHGRSYRELEASGTMLPVIELTIRYAKPCRFDDELDLATTATQSGPSRIRFATAISTGGVRIGSADVTVACVDGKGRPKRIDDGLLHLLDQAQQAQQ